jgi:hypothetical protein
VFAAQSFQGAQEMASRFLPPPLLLEEPEPPLDIKKKRAALLLPRRQLAVGSNNSVMRRSSFIRGEAMSVVETACLVVVDGVLEQVKNTGRGGGGQ